MGGQNGPQFSKKRGIATVSTKAPMVQNQQEGQTLNIEKQKEISQRLLCAANVSEELGPEGGWMRVSVLWGGGAGRKKKKGLLCKALENPGSCRHKSVRKFRGSWEGRRNLANLEDKF